MKFSKIIVSLAILITICIFQNAFAGGPLFPFSKAKPSNQNKKMATYSIPDLDTAMVVHKIAKAVADQPGISSAKPDFKNKQFAIIFNANELDPEKLLEAIATVSPDSKLVSVSAAPALASPSKHAGCPAAKRAKCSKANTKKAAE